MNSLTGENLNGPLLPTKTKLVAEQKVMVQAKLAAFGKKTLHVLLFSSRTQTNVGVENNYSVSKVRSNSNHDSKDDKFTRIM